MCTRIDVPGGTFDLPRDDRSVARGVRVAGFTLDKYEATVGRFRAWVDAAIRSPKTARSSTATTTAGRFAGPARRRSSRNGRLAALRHLERRRRASPEELRDLGDGAGLLRLRGRPAADGGGVEICSRGRRRAAPVPWGSAAPTPARAVYNCSGDGKPDCALSDILPVGSRPDGAGQWGHADLAGSMFEWTLKPGATRGGGFCFIGGVDRRTQPLPTALTRREDDPDTMGHMVGVRCAYDAPAGG